MRGRFGWMAVVVLGLVGGAAHAAVTPPYSNNFSDSVSDFTASTVGGGWTHDPTAGIYYHTSTPGTAATYSAHVNAPDLSGESFSLQARFVMPSLGLNASNQEMNGNSGTTYVGLSVQASGGATTGYSLRGFGTSTVSDRLRIFRGTTSVANATDGFQWRNFVGDTFVITLSGIYNEDGSLDLTGVVNNVTDNITRTVTFHDASPLAGGNFGMVSFYSSSNALRVNWDSVTLVPEPGSLAAVILGAGLLLRRRRA